MSQNQFRSPRKHHWDILEPISGYLEAQPAKPPLRIACAGIEYGKAENFEGSSLTSILPQAFHLPEMDITLAQQQADVGHGRA